MTKKSNLILLVEDNEDDVFLMERAIKKAGIYNPVFVADDGNKAIDYLAGSGSYSDRTTYPVPVVVFLDLKLPEIRGHDILAWIRDQPDLKELPVIVLTSSNEPNDIKGAYRLGATSYMVKPPSADQLLDMARAFKWEWLEAEENSPASPDRNNLN